MDRRKELTRWLAALGITSLTMPLSADDPAVFARDSSVLGAAGGAKSAMFSATQTAKKKVSAYVVINHEEQYSIWPAALEAPRGWRRVTNARPLGAAVEEVAARADELRFRVVVNHEEQYSIWPDDREPPKGFRIQGKQCVMPECAEWILKSE